MSNFVCFVKVMREVNVLRIPPTLYLLPTLLIYLYLKLKNKNYLVVSAYFPQY